MKIFALFAILLQGLTRMVFHPFSCATYHLTTSYATSNTIRILSYGVASPRVKSHAHSSGLITVQI